MRADRVHARHAKWSNARGSAGSGALQQAAAFVLFRIFDIAKPPPIRQVDQTVHGGIGVMADDFIAAGYALLVLAIAQRVFFE
jgi:phosphatidylglycerophosphatase A